MMGKATKPSSIQQFLTLLKSKRDDRGMMAALRQGFNPATEYRAWPYIAGWCDLARDKERVVWLTIAAGFATHGATAECGNMGRTLRQIALEGPEGNKDKALESFDACFRRLLTCASADELCRLLPGILRAAERKNIQVDFERLFWDLMTWHKPERKVKVEWAQSYWGSNDSVKKEKP